MGRDTGNTGLCCSVMTGLENTIWGLLFVLDTFCENCTMVMGTKIGPIVSLFYYNFLRILALWISNYTPNISPQVTSLRL